MPSPQSPLPHLLRGAALAALAALPLAAGQSDREEDGPGPPAAYEALRDARLEPGGRIEAGTLRIDRFTFELTGGDLYVLPDGGAAGDVAVYLGDGVVRCYPPDGVEHQQVEKFLDEDLLEEPFDRFVFWLAGDAGARLRALPAARRAATPGGPTTCWTIGERRCWSISSRTRTAGCCSTSWRRRRPGRRPGDPHSSTRRSTGTTTAGSRLKSSRGRARK